MKPICSAIKVVDKQALFAEGFRKYRNENIQMMRDRAAINRGISAMDLEIRRNSVFAFGKALGLTEEQMESIARQIGQEPIPALG